MMSMIFRYLKKYDKYGAYPTWNSDLMDKFEGKFIVGILSGFAICYVYIIQYVATKIG